MKPALVIIDLQKFFFRTEERNSGLPKLIEGINELADFFHDKGLPVIHVFTQHKADKSTWDKTMKRENQAVLIGGSEEAMPLDEIHRRPDDNIVIKFRHSCFLWTELEEFLHENKIDTLVITGVYTHACVSLTSIEAVERDYDILLSEDATFSHLQKETESMLHMLNHDYNVVPVSNKRIMELIGR